MALNLARNSRLFVSTVDTGFDSTNTWEVLVQDGFSFSQGIDTQDVTVNEAGATPTRGSETFNTQLQPAEWSLTSYVRSYEDAETSANHTAVEAIMWAGLVSSQAPDFNDSGNSVTGTPTSFDIDYSTSDVHELLKLNLYFYMDNVWYQVKEAQVNQAEVDFSIDGIAMITWSGQGTEVVETVTFPDIITVPAGTDPTAIAYADRGTGGDATSGYLAVPPIATYIKNKLSTISLVAAAGQNDAATNYDIAITGGSLTLANNVTYLTPETLSIVDKPIGSFTGARQLSGTLTCYLDTKANGSSTLIKNLSTNLNTKNSYALTLNVGGPTGSRAVFTLPTAHLSVPVLDVQDVLGLNIDFSAQGSAGVNSTDEMTISYFNS